MLLGGYWERECGDIPWISQDRTVELMKLYLEDDLEIADHLVVTLGR